MSTLLHQLQRDAGGVEAAARTTTPLMAHFGDAAAEYASMSESAVVFDVSDRTQIAVSGEDRAAFLHNFCTNDVKQLASGRGCEAFFTNVKARVLGFANLFAGEESICIDSIAEQAENLLQHLDRYIITEDVQLTDQTEEQGMLFVCGPEGATKLTAALSGGDPVERIIGLAAWDHCTIALDDEVLSVRRVDSLGTCGLQVCAVRDALPKLWTRMMQSGIRPAGADVHEAARIAAGTPVFGIDVNDEHLAPEVDRNDTAISFTKGCYLGQEPIARIDALGHVNRRLRVIESTERLKVGESVHDGQGLVTSCAALPGQDGSVGLAWVRQK